MRYSFLILALVAGIANAGADYTVKKGINWKGVKIGSSSPSGSDHICRNYECYPLFKNIPVSRQLMDRYQLSSLKFSALQKVATSTEGDLITLPADLADVLFKRSKERVQRAKFSDSN
ncbi:hypothetical protein [Aliamphritea hakodatensis]|uniref:hypothetical protein n=1 Tax=Aliamphritea hakodatensis TaxID=2895352 RepID=UPI0022FDA417|nr:hypothetical protein [Aliamphritea hakodatensis]